MESSKWGVARPNDLGKGAVEMRELHLVRVVEMRELRLVRVVEMRELRLAQ
jgi:hypothetical protein